MSQEYQAYCTGYTYVYVFLNRAYSVFAKKKVLSSSWLTTRRTARFMNLLISTSVNCRMLSVMVNTSMING